MGEEQINKVMAELNDLINNMKISEEISKAVTKSQSPDVNVNTAIIQTDQTLIALNSIKSELCRLPMDFCEREYIANYITPLLTALDFLSTTGLNLSTSVNILTNSPIVPRKKGKLKDTIHTIYSINEKCEEIYEVIKDRLSIVIHDDTDCCK